MISSSCTDGMIAHLHLHFHIVRAWLDACILLLLLPYDAVRVVGCRPAAAAVVAVALVALRMACHHTVEVWHSSAVEWQSPVAGAVAMPSLPDSSVPHAAAAAWHDRPLLAS